MTAPHPRGAEYRRDIDGIRAVAVAAVVLFHLGVPLIHGGFAGVDVFFVISGYLITGIIVRALEKGDFTIRGFYSRRIKRIVPALLVVLLAAWLAGWMFMYAREFWVLGRDILSGSTFVSNFVFYHGLGYWDEADKPLLHLWSLAVEEQFYLIWPLTMLLVWRTKRNVRWTIIAIIEISFVINIYQVRHSGVPAAFYLPLARFWEILSGALLLQIENSTDSIGQKYRNMSPRFRDVMSIAGAALIVLTIAIVHPYDLWPGFKGVMPVVGTLLLIAAGPAALVNRTVLSSRPLVALGLISYPLYLWHWPIIVYGWLLFEEVLPAWYAIAVIPVSIVLAAATYQFVEKPIRFGNRKKKAVMILVPGLVATALLGLATYNGPVGPRLQPAAETIYERWGEGLEIPNNKRSPNGGRLYQLHQDDSNTLLFWGDSHMAQYWPRVDQLARARNGKHPTVVMMTYPGCPIFPGRNNGGRDSDGVPWTCDQFNRDVIAYASKPNVKALVISVYWESFVKDHLPPGSHRHPIVIGDPESERVLKLFENEIGDLVKAGKKVYIVLSNPVQQVKIEGLPPRRLSGIDGPPRPYATLPFHLALTNQTSTRLRQIAANTGAIIIDPTPYLCNATSCADQTSEGEPMYRDENHLRGGYVRRHATWFDQIFQ